jgi:2-oxoglutarate ferredoxin oxidoreductase subunit alpha
MRKLDLAAALVPPPIRFGSSPKGADVSVICFGTTVQPVREAVGWLARDGVKVAAMQVVTVWPFPTEDVATFLGTSKRTIVIEGNFTGQLEGLIRQECLLGVDEHLHRYDGRPFAPEQVYATLKEVADRA